MEYSEEARRAGDRWKEAGVLTIGSLFSGYGGLERGVQQGLAQLGQRSRVLWQAEKDPYARAVLARHWPQVHRYEDVHDIDESAERPDILEGGSPCQDLSIAGKRAGIDGARSGLWFEFVRIVRILRPRIVFVENVPELLGYLGRVLGPLAELGFDAEWDLFDAAAVGAPHRRERLFILAYADGDGREGGQRGGARAAQQSALRGCGAVADADGERRERGPWDVGARGRAEPADGGVVPDTNRDGLAHAQQQIEVTRLSGTAGLGDDGGARPMADPMFKRRPRPENGPHEGRERPAIRGGWAPEPDVGRVVDGPSSRLDARRRRARLRCLGNGAVEQQAALALVTLARRADLDLGGAQ